MRPHNHLEGSSCPQSPKASDRTARLRFLLEPESVAIIGASDDPSRIGGRPLRYLLNEGFEGTIYAVNPNRDVVQGQKAYSSISDVPQAVDCAVISVPAKIVVDTLESCAASGARSAIIFSSGFAEMGDEGEAMQAELKAISDRTGIRVVGPNCLGLLSFQNRFFPTFSSSGDAGYPEAGPLAIVSQSGAYGTHVYAVARSWGLGVSYVITTGNECDVDVAECIAWMADDDNVKVIAAYAEGVKDGPALPPCVGEGARERETGHLHESGPQRGGGGRCGVTYRIACRLGRNIRRGFPAIRCPPRRYDGGIAPTWPTPVPQAFTPKVTASA